MPNSTAPKGRLQSSLQVHVAQTPHLPRKVSRHRGKKLLELPARSREPEAAVPQLRNGPQRPTRPLARLPAPRPRASRADPGAHRGRGWALTWHPPSNVQVLAVLKQVSRRKKKEKKIQLCKWLRTGRRALDLRRLPHEFGSSRAGRFMGRVTATPGPAAEHREVH